MAAKKTLVNVDIISDLTCPFCWLGKKRLDASMKRLEDQMEFQINWLPYQLRPDAPPEGFPPEDVPMEPSRMARLKQFGKEVGIHFNFSYKCLPNTTLAHTLLAYVGSKDKGNKQYEVAEMIFKAHLTDGVMLSEETMVELGKEAGFNEEEVRTYITDPANLEAVRQASQDNCLKINEGVPTFYFNGHIFSGFQNEDSIIRMITDAAESFPEDEESKS